MLFDMHEDEAAEMRLTRDNIKAFMLVRLRVHPWLARWFFSLSPSLYIDISIYLFSEKTRAQNNINFVIVKLLRA